MWVNSPSAALDLSKPVLSLRKEVKEEVDLSVHSSMIQYYNKLVSQKKKHMNISSKNKQEKMIKPATKTRISTAVASNKRSIAIQTRKRVMTKEGKRQKLTQESKPIDFSNSRSKSRSKENSRSPIGIRPTSKEKSLHLSKIDEKRTSLRVKKRKINTGSGIIGKAHAGQEKSGERSKKRRKSKKNSSKKR